MILYESVTKTVAILQCDRCKKKQDHSGHPKMNALQYNVMVEGNHGRMSCEDAYLHICQDCVAPLAIELGGNT